MKYFTLKYLKISRKFWKKFHGNFEIFQDPFFEIFHEIFNFHYKVYEINRKYIMLFMHNKRYLPLTGLLTLLQWTIHPAPVVHCEIFEIFHEIFHAKKFHEILHHYLHLRTRCFRKSYLDLIVCLTVPLLGDIAESESAYCYTCYRSVVCPSVCMSSVTLMRPAKAVGRNRMPFGIDTRVVPSNVVLDSGLGPPREGEILGSEPQFASMPPIAELYFGPCWLLNRLIL